VLRLAAQDISATLAAADAGDEDLVPWGLTTVMSSTSLRDRRKSSYQIVIDQLEPAGRWRSDLHWQRARCGAANLDIGRAAERAD